MSSPQGVTGKLTTYGDVGFSQYIRRAFLSSAGFDRQDMDRPAIGIIDTSSDYTPCHRDMPQLVDAVRRGVLQAGGLPLVCPTLSIGETIIAPTGMLYRNLLAMETEEAIRAYPMDAVVLVGGCDKTVPAQWMAAVSANVPAIGVVAGPMRAGSWHGEPLGACTDCRGYWDRYRAGELQEHELREVEQNLCSTAGTCMVMGTASTMACTLEALGLMLPGSAAAPADSGDRLRNGVASGRRAVELAHEGIRPGDVLSPATIKNALTVLMALGGSTNAVIHLTAIAGRAGIKLTLDDLHAAGQKIPLLVDCKPAGGGYLPDLHAAGGMPALLKVLEPHLELTTRGVTGRTLGDLLQEVPLPGAWQQTIRSLENPLGPPGALAALRGTLAPAGAVIKPAAATPELLKHRGPALVFESPEDVATRIDDPRLNVTADHVLVLRNSGPVAAGMPESGSIPIPRQLAVQGVKDMVRVSDARMSGTAYGTVVLHCSPESAVGGPLALVQDGDLIELDVSGRRIDLMVAAQEMERRRQNFVPPPLPERGWRQLYAQHVTQADQGADLDFLMPSSEAD